MTKEIGDLDQGGVYVGISVSTGKELHAALADEATGLSFGEAFAAAAEMRKIPGRENAHVPTLAELSENLFANKDKGYLKGSFTTALSHPDDFTERFDLRALYRSYDEWKSPVPEKFEDSTWTLWFDEGNEDVANGGKQHKLSVRLVW